MLSHFNGVFTLNKQRSSVSILMRRVLFFCFVMYIGYLWLVPRSQCACIPPEQSQWSPVLSALSLIPSSTRLYKWSPCSYQGYQLVWNIRPVRVRTMILSSPRLLVTLLLLYFTHAFHSCAFISFLSRRAEKHSRSAKGKKRRRLESIYVKEDVR